MNSDQYHGSGQLPEDITPLPGVKAQDPDTGAEDPRRSYEEIADELEDDPAIDSDTGTILDADDDDLDDDIDEDGTDRLGAVPFTPVQPKHLGG
ncbi:hypothetical protein [Tessaracoccus sp. ZS01]|uniref:hypothetical protein n=1 Tax=Tessaracoccus sp. ZS01 TaxID=1906324 RepID=UPI00096FD425|nr:hypothetical protein [Tessaracoccus sp. ZS01]MCG6567751.1 hypothetical protein [Tessaracoccus sp. ZS01]OMG55496.1 hypothetical protein BJN44_09010 [Tessaracoccus sp. ZS01]